MLTAQVRVSKAVNVCKVEIVVFVEGIQRLGVRLLGGGRR